MENYVLGDIYEYISSSKSLYSCQNIYGERLEITNYSSTFFMEWFRTNELITLTLIAYIC